MKEIAVVCANKNAIDIFEMWVDRNIPSNLIVERKPTYCLTRKAKYILVRTRKDCAGKFDDFYTIHPWEEEAQRLESFVRLK